MGGPFFTKKQIAIVRKWIEEGAEDDTPSPDFNRDVLPLLTESVNGSVPCKQCHYNNNDATSRNVLLHKHAWTFLAGKV